MNWKDHFLLYRFWECGAGSHDAVFFIPVFGNRNYDKKWFKLTIMPICKIGKFFHNMKWWIYHRVHPRHRYHTIKTGLKPGYYDQDIRMLYGCMALLESYIEDQGGADELDKFSQELLDSPEEWGAKTLESQANYQKEATAIYRWWKDRPNREKEIEDELMSCGKNYKRYWEMNDKLNEEDQKMLHRLIDIRPSLWT